MVSKNSGSPALSMRPLGADLGHLKGCMVTLYVNLFYHEGYGETPKDFPPP
jgi:hypothetical protein